MTATTSMVDTRPALRAADVEAALKRHYGLQGSLAPLPAEWDQNYRLDADSGARFVVKIANAADPRAVLDLQNSAMEHLGRAGLDTPTPRVVPSNDGSTMCAVHDIAGRPCQLRVLSFLEGTPLARLTTRRPALHERIGTALGRVDAALETFDHPAGDRPLRWDLAAAQWISAHTRTIARRDRRACVERLLLQYRGRIRPRLDALPVSIIHNDANDENLLVGHDAAGEPTVAGLLDFGDMVRSHTVNELAIACAYAIFGVDDPLAPLLHMARGYHAARPLSEDEADVLVPLVCMRLCVSVTMSAIARRDDPDNAHAQISDAAAWDALERLHDVDWTTSADAVRRACGKTGPREETGDRCDDARRLRDAHIGPSLSLAGAPLLITRGQGQFLFNEQGRAFLDCVNNVCHVGHCHPDVVAALTRQASVLNTNTRYLHPLLGEYARRLAATLPDPLSVCFFVNSGSEANELAIRLARTHTGRQGAVVLEHGYHGNTSTLVDLSPYKCEGPGGGGLADWARAATLPDAYRGQHRGPEAGHRYAESVRDACAALDTAGLPPAFFLCESIIGCGGQVVPPPGYLAEAFAHARAAGAVCIADEVQVGFGRPGAHMWAFESQGVVPDIVTMGKPIGNGHPLGAVVTTRPIAESFDNGMEFFNTFGGSPVSCAVGLAVLDVIERESLQDHAADVGAYLAAGFERLADAHALIGDVRGLGLFMGVEIVTDRASRRPATEVTARVLQHVRADGILLSAEGPGHNVLKIKPPLVFDHHDADLLLGSVDRALVSVARGES
ncbi:MAG: aminotransferase class III-fold pyridoxal phosphate-dependent enzyme [Planctomycetota bacterium]